MLLPFMKSAMLMIMEEALTVAVSSFSLGKNWVSPASLLFNYDQAVHWLRLVYFAVSPKGFYTDVEDWTGIDCLTGKEFC